MISLLTTNNKFSELVIRTWDSLSSTYALQDSHSSSTLSTFSIMLTIGSSVVVDVFCFLMIVVEAAGGGGIMAGVSLSIWDRNWIVFKRSLDGFGIRGRSGISW